MIIPPSNEKNLNFCLDAVSSKKIIISIKNKGKQGMIQGTSCELCAASYELCEGAISAQDIIYCQLLIALCLLPIHL